MSIIKKYFGKSSRKNSFKSNDFASFPSFLYNSSSENTGPHSYNNNAIVHRCVSLIATSASHVPWQIFSKNQGRVLPTHPALTLLQNPNSFKSGADFFAENIANLLLCGESYMLFSKSENGQLALHNLPSNNVSCTYNKGKLIAYNYNNGSEKSSYRIDQPTGISRVLRIYNYNPNNNQSGLSSLSAASKAINLHAKIMDWNKSLLNNASRPSGALVFQNGEGYLTDEQFERLKEQFYTNFSGSSNSGKPLILEGGLKWQETNNAERFEKFIELKDSSARDIAIAFNVPPQLLGINGDNTYSNMQEARLALWEENIIPLLDKYSDALSHYLSYWYDEDLRVDFDRESISVLTKRREDLWSKITNADFMTINEKRSFVGLPPIKGGEDLKQ